MNYILIHGLGQSKTSWDKVIEKQLVCAFMLVRYLAWCGFGTALCDRESREGDIFDFDRAAI